MLAADSQRYGDGVTGHCCGQSLRRFIVGNTAVVWCINKATGGGNRKWKA